MKLLIAASGTGGHLFPALAVADRLAPAHDIVWLGVPDRLETSLVADRYPLYTIPVEGFQGPLGIQTLIILQRLIRGIFQTRKLLKKHQIDHVFSTGGYIAAPAIIAARSLGLPVTIHESNYIPGKVTKLLQRWCTHIALGFTQTANYLPQGRTQWVSTPVREEFLSPQPMDLPIPEDRPLVVVVGGSQGAVSVNKLIRACAPAWLDQGIYLVHLTGSQDPDASSLNHPHYFQFEFHHQIAALLQRADLAISRAGAGTTTELAITHTPSILIPYPFAAENHQKYNAEVFAQAGAAIVYEQQTLTPDILQQTVFDLLQDQTRLEQMKVQAATLALADSSDRLVDLILNTPGKH